MISDAASSVAQACLARGIAKLNYVLELLGYETTATFEVSPDFSITKNKERFDSGFANGVYYAWGDGSLPIVFPDIKPNGCGMLAIELDALPDSGDLIARAEKLSRDGWEISTGNHFIIAGTKKSGGYFAVIHCGSGKKGALYGAKAERYETPWGQCSVLRGPMAENYYETYRSIDGLSRMKRIEYADALFGPTYTIISNETHQGMLSLNEIALGCHRSDGETIYPLTISNNDLAYLVRAPKGNIIPHGSGYQLPDYTALIEERSVGERRFFVFALRSGNREIVEYPFSTAYRGKEVVDLAAGAGIITVVDELVITTSLKF